MPLPKVPTGIEKQVNEAFEEVRSNVNAFQNAYFVQHGKYWQGLKNPPVTPKDGNNSAVDKTVRPTDQDKDWEDIELKSGYPVSIEVHTHELHGNKWYSVIGTIEIGGQIYQRVNDNNWVEVIEYGN